MPPQYIFTTRDLRKVVPPKREILRGISLAFFPGAKIGVLGPNGAGKTSLLRIMAGVDDDFLGEARPAEGIRIGFLPQEPRLDPSKDVLGNIEEGVAGTRALLTEFEAVTARLGEPVPDGEMERLLAEQARLQDAIEAAGGWDLDRTVEIAMEALRVPPGDQDVRTVSGGEARRVALCRLLLERPDMLLLDEPTNHLDAESVAWLERYLQEYPGTVVAVTHDRYFLDNVAGWILELDRGYGIPWQGNYSSWLEQKQARLRVEEHRKDGGHHRIALEGAVAAHEGLADGVAEFVAGEHAVDHAAGRFGREASFSRDLSDEDLRDVDAAEHYVHDGAPFTGRKGCHEGIEAEVDSALDLGGAELSDQPFSEAGDVVVCHPEGGVALSLGALADPTAERRDELRVCVAGVVAACADDQRRGEKYGQ